VSDPYEILGLIESIVINESYVANKYQIKPRPYEQKNLNDESGPQTQVILVEKRS